MVAEGERRFREEAPMTAAAAATVILDGVKADRWRILVGEDARRIDAMVRQSPERAYDVDFLRASQPRSAGVSADETVTSLGLPPPIATLRSDASIEGSARPRAWVKIRLRARISLGPMRLRSTAWSYNASNCSP